jgi:toxin HigB-1
MIRSFKCKKTKDLFDDRDVKRFKSIERPARRRLMLLHQAKDLRDLMSPPSLCLEGLKGDRKGQYSIRLNKQWRICFIWDGHDAWDVEIVDYH